MNAPSKIEADTIHAAMAKAFAEIEGATKSANNPHFKSKYADLTSVIEAIKPALAANGLFFTQCPTECSGGVQIKTYLHHRGGENLFLGELFVPANKNDAQAYGSALTYARRYALVTAFGVPVEDDDGNAAAKSAPEQAPVKQPAHSALKAKVRAFVHELNGCGDADELTAFLATADSLAVVREVKDKLPDWWTGWPEQPDGFTPLSDLITRRQHECAQATANYMTA